MTALELAQRKHQQLQARLAPQEKLLGMLITSTSAQQLTHGNGRQSQRGDGMPGAVANATTAVDVITQFNDLLAKLRTLGIIAT